MKDAYSFDIDQAGLEESYQAMHAPYTAVFERLGLEFRVVDADSGEIGGSRSQEFHVLADSGEDAIAWCDEDNYASNVETAATLRPGGEAAAPTLELEKVSTPGARSIERARLDAEGRPAENAQDPDRRRAMTGPIALALRGDHELNAIKAMKLPGVAEPLTMADPETVRKATGCEPGFAGPIGLDIPVLLRPRHLRDVGLRDAARTSVTCTTPVSISVATSTRRTR